MFRQEWLDHLPQLLKAIIQDSLLLKTELILASGIVLLLILFLIFKSEKKWLISIVAVCLLSFGFFVLLHSPEKATVFFQGQLLSDEIAKFSKLIILISGILSLLMLIFNAQKQQNHAEYLILLVTLVLACLLMSMSINLLMIYLSIETASIAAYMLTAFGFKSKNYEGSLKYLLFGGLSSALMLYGMSLLYGITGTLNIMDPDFVLKLSEAPSWLIIFPSLLVLTGFFFKIGMVPFHIWIPDAFEVAPLPIAAFFSIAPKVAGLVLIYRILSLDILNRDLQYIVIILTMIGISWGNLAALRQSNIKRMLGYASMAQAGYLMISILILPKFGWTSFMFYTAIYAAANYMTFYAVSRYDTLLDTVNVENYAGVGKKLPVLSIFITTALIALIGLPPTAGFNAKLYIFEGLWASWQLSGSSSFLYLLIVAVLNVAISLFYYLKIPYFLFFKKENKEPDQITSINYPILYFLMLSPIIVFFIKPNWLIQLLEIIIK